MTKNTILIADDHEIVRTGLATIFEYQKDFSVIGQASDGAEVVEIAAATHPDVIIMDLMMPIKNGVEATKEILHRFPAARIIILTTYATSTEITNAIEAGAAGAISKDTPNIKLLEYIRGVLSGKFVLSPDIQNLIRSEQSRPRFSKRQLEVLSAIVRGLSNKDISTMLGISEDGVKFHLRVIYAKLGAANRTEAAAIAIRKHLLKI